MLTAAAVIEPGPLTATDAADYLASCLPPPVRSHRCSRCGPPPACLAASARRQSRSAARSARYPVLSRSLGAPTAAVLSRQLPSGPPSSARHRDVRPAALDCSRPPCGGQPSGTAQHRCRGPAVQLSRRRQVGMVVVKRLYTIPITCCLDGLAHDVTDENVAAGRKAGGGTRRSAVMSSCPRRWSRRSAGHARGASRCWRRISRPRPRPRLADRATRSPGGCGDCCTSGIWRCLAEARFLCKTYSVSGVSSAPNGARRSPW